MDLNGIHLYYCHTHYSEVDENKLLRECAFLPADHIQRIRRYVHIEDRCNRLMASLLLRHGAGNFGVEFEFGVDLRVTERGRPYINRSCLDFNISHSGSTVILAMTHGRRVGVDIEEIKPMQVEQFERTCSPREWSWLQRSTEKSLDFLRLWTAKESILKGDGRGLGYPLASLDLYPVSEIPLVLLGEQQWRTVPVPVTDEAVCHLAYTTSLRERELEESEAELHLVDCSWQVGWEGVTISVTP